MSEGSSTNSDNGKAEKEQPAKKRPENFAAMMDDIRARAEENKRMQEGEGAEVASPLPVNNAMEKRMGTGRSAPGSSFAAKMQAEKQRKFEQANAHVNKPSESHITSGIVADRKQDDSGRGQSKKSEIDKTVRDNQSMNDRMNARRQRISDRVKAGVRSRLSQSRERADMDAVSLTIIMFIFPIAIVSDILETILTLTVLGISLGSVIGVIATSIVGYLWWCIGAADFSGRMKKIARRTSLTFLGEICFSAWPFLTIECCLNFLDFIGAFDNKAGAEVKKVIG